MNTRAWLADQIHSDVKKAIPILSFPAIRLLGVSVAELVSDGDLQARGMKAVADRCDAAASVSMMDLSVEAEAFGAQVQFSDDEVPTVTGILVPDEEAARALKAPPVGAGRTRRSIDAIGRAAERITDRPVFAGVIGPFSLAGRLMGMTEAMIACYTDPGTVHRVLDKAARFIAEYIGEYKKAGAHGVVMAEPAAGVLSPDLNDAFSTPYVRRIVEAAQDDGFIVIYHNCGNALPLIDSILTNGAAAYHFGNAVSMSDMLARIPAGVPVMGNVDPSGQFRSGTPESVRQATLRLLEQCGRYPNFIVSSGCDIPPLTPWENIDAFFAAVREFYRTK